MSCHEIHGVISSAVCFTLESPWFPAGWNLRFSISGDARSPRYLSNTRSTVLLGSLRMRQLCFSSKLWKIMGWVCYILPGCQWPTRIITAHFVVGFFLQYKLWFATVTERRATHTHTQLCFFRILAACLGLYANHLMRVSIDFAVLSGGCWAFPFKSCNFWSCKLLPRWILLSCVFYWKLKKGMADS